MEGDKIILCRLCLKICQTEFESIDKSTRETLNFLLLWMNLDISHEPVICTSCKRNLKICLDFKTDYLLKTNSTYVKNRNIDMNDLKLDLSARTKNSGSSVSSSGICAFCMELVILDSSVFLKNEAKDVMTTLEKYFPEVALNITEDSITCTSCYKSMQITVGFNNSCVDVEEKVKEYCNIEGTNSDGQIELTALLNFTSKSHLKGLDVRGDNIAKVEEDCKQLKNEGDTEIKFEDYVEVEEQVLSYIKKEPGIKVEEDDDDRSKTPIQDTKINMEMSLGLPPYKCHTCTYQSYSEDSLRRHICNNYQHASEIELHACKLCPYQTDSKGGMHQHMLTHKSFFGVNIQTKDKKSLPTHKNVTKTMHKCKICAFQSKHKISLNRHMLSHKSTSEVEMFKCDKCPFQSKYKNSVQMHTLVHKSASELTMYKCDTCTFETKTKGRLRRHMLTHKSINEVTMHKCKICAFQTKHIFSLTEHNMFTHKGTAKVEKFKCAMCSFQSIRKSNLREHVLIHKSTSELTVYKCDLCTFETKRKGSLRVHVLTHKSITDVITYKCKICPFQSRYKGSTKKHMLTHRKVLER